MDDSIDDSAGNKDDQADFLRSVEDGKFNFGIDIKFIGFDLHGVAASSFSSFSVLIPTGDNLKHVPDFTLIKDMIWWKEP